MARLPDPRRRIRHDVLLAAGACLLDLLLFSHLLGDPNQPAGAPSVLARLVVVAYALVGYAALCWRRRFPTTVFTILLLHSLAAVAMPDYRPTLALLIALYTVAAYRTGWVAPAALAGGFLASAGVVANEVGNAAEPLREETALAVGSFFAVVNLGVWAAGRWVFASRRHVEHLEYRRQVEAREAVNAERVRIARELHDIVAHAVTVMILQSAGAKSILTRDPERATRALAAIEEHGQQAMAELRRLLTVLRATDEHSSTTTTDPTPDTTAAGVPSLSNMDSLVASARRAGLVVRVETDGSPRQLERGVDLTAYRVVQEALTNAIRHAGPGSTVVIGLLWRPEQLTIEITDDGHGRPRSSAKGLSTGHGLLGLRERVAVVNGELRVGPAGDGFQVAATLPTDGSERDGAVTATATATAGEPA